MTFTRRAWRLSSIGAFLILLTALVGSRPQPAAAVTSDSPSQWSWIGNTHGGLGFQHVQSHCYGAWVAPDGTVICNTVWDEGGSEGGIYKDGRNAGNLLDAHWDGGGYAVTGDASYVYMGAHNNGTNQEGISRYKLSDHTGAACPNCTEHLNNFRANQSGSPVRGLTVSGGKLYAVVFDKNVVEIYNTADMAYQGSFSVPGPTRIAADGSGRLWIATGGDVKAYSTAGATLGITIAEPDDPTALAVDNQNRLLVGDDGVNRQQVLIYDISGTPARVETVGQSGGLFAPPVGQVGPLRFTGIVGVGTDSAGNLYVAQDHPTRETASTGTNIEAYSRSGSTWTRKWQVLGLEFLDLADADTSTYSNGVLDVYDASHHFKVDLSKPIGQQWTWVGEMFNRFTDPNDPRGGAHDAAVEPRVVTLGGQKFLAVTGMYGGHMYFYRFVPGTELSRLALDVPIGGYGYVAGNGDLWVAKRDGISKKPFQGLDSAGKPQYGAEESYGVPAPFNSIGRVRYDASKDVLYVVGFTPVRPTWPSMDKVMGTTMVRYDRWSQGNRSATWTTILPYNSSATLYTAFLGMVAMDVTSDRIYAVGLNRDRGNSGPGPRMHVYDAATGVDLANWTPEGPNPVVATDGWANGHDNGPAGWVDLEDGINARQLPDGQTLVFQEEDFQAKILMYRIGTGPTSTGAPTSTPSPTPNATPTVTSSPPPTQLRRSRQPAFLRRRSPPADARTRPTPTIPT